MMNKYQSTARRLRDAYGGQTLSPLRECLGPTDSVGAYKVQMLNTEFWRERGRRVVGRKVGLTAKAVQAQLGVSQPDFGVLFDDMEIPNRGTLSRAKVIQPKAEAEIALILARDLNSPEVTSADVAAASAYAVAAIEIVDSRITDWKISFADTVADNGSSAFFVLGEPRRGLEGLDLYTCGMAMTVNGEVASSGAGVACLGHPLNAAAWLVRTMAEQGEGLRAGDIILTGALGPMVTLTPGDHVEAQIGGVGSASFSFK
jgi:2-keto-4-pentenoate hydratase